MRRNTLVFFSAKSMSSRRISVEEVATSAQRTGAGNIGKSFSEMWEILSYVNFFLKKLRKQQQAAAGITSASTRVRRRVSINAFKVS